MKHTDRFITSSESLARTVGDDLVLLDLPSGTYYSLNAVGAEAWRLLGHGASAKDICDDLEKNFAVDRATLETDIAELLSDLHQRGLIRAV